MSRVLASALLAVLVTLPAEAAGPLALLAKQIVKQMVQDYVKSEPRDKFFDIDPNITADGLIKICQEFRDAREPLFEGGFVLKSMAKLRKYRVRDEHGSRLVNNEWRYYCIRKKGKIKVMSPYPRNGIVNPTSPGTYRDTVKAVASTLPSNFFCVDVVEKEAGDHILVRGH